MSPTAKDLDVTNPNSRTPGVRPASVGAQEENAGKPQPVPLEVPVTVNGARTVEGSDKREPFSETTQTVLVFGNGAVIRLASSVAAGQLLFLTNEKVSLQKDTQPVLCNENPLSRELIVPLPPRISLVGGRSRTCSMNEKCRG